MKEVSVSVIVPNYNHADYLKKRIDSVLCQTFSDFELIILDDCSNDYSHSIIEEYRNHPKVSEIIYNVNNSGTTFRQWKRGLELSKGDLVWIAESDDWAHEEFLEHAVRAFQQHPNLCLFYADSYIIADDNWRKASSFAVYRNRKFQTEKWSKCHLANGKKELNEWLKYYCTINNASAVVFKKESALKIIDEVSEYMYSGDWMFYIRLAVDGDIFYCNKPLNYYREHTQNFSLQSFKNTRQQRDLFRILKTLYELDFVVEKQELLRFYMRQYCDVGVKRFGIKRYFQLIASYFRIDPLLALKAVSVIVQTRLNKLFNGTKYSNTNL